MMRRQWFAVPTILALLAGCGSSAAPGGSTPAASGGGAAAAKEIPVGVLLPFSGPAGPLGEEIKRGFEFAAGEINAAGGIKSLGGAQLKLIYSDTQGKPEVGAQAAENLILKDKVDVLMDALQSPVVLSVQTVAEKYQVPFIVPHGTADQIVQRGYKWTYRISPPASWAGRDSVRFLQYLNSKGGRQAKKVALIWENSAFGQSNANGARDYLKQAGFDIILDEGYASSSPDLSPLVLRVKSANPDVIFASSQTADATQIANDLQKYDVNVMGLIGVGGSGWSDPTLIKNAGKNLDYAFVTEVFGCDVNRPYVKQECDAFKAKYNEDFSAEPAGGYSALYLYADALQRAGSLDKQKVHEALSGTDIKDGRALVIPQTEMKFDEHGQDVNAVWVAQQFLNGQWHTVWPTDFAGSGYTVTWPVPPYESRK